jgi:anthranilate synthase/aminodeoxychorismate synthase-like glutamine amidotransferase
LTLILIIDNYDSFTYNLFQYFSELDAELMVARNDKITLREIETLSPRAIVISPGPSTPERAGISNEVIGSFGDKLPILGVCLGHQCVGYTYGGRVSYAGEIMHGKSSLIYHDDKGVLCGLPNPFEAIRYHSLAIQPENLPDCLEVTARTDKGIIMGVRHREYPVEGVQFHPESIMTRVGKDLLQNFLRII